MDATIEEQATGSAWTSVLAVEGTRTGDGRLIEEGALTWRELPLTLMAMVETTEGGHLGAKVAGRIDTIERVGNEIVATGVFDAGEYGAEIERLVRDQTLRGVSVDLQVLDYEIRDADGNVLEGDAVFDALMAEDEITFVMLEAVIGMATVCPFQAIEEATISLVASARRPGIERLLMPFCPWPDPLDSLTASAAGQVPLHPPAEWFEMPVLDGPTAFTITDEGRVFGHAALWGTCHTANDRGVCQTPPHSPTDYSHFHLGEVVCDDGSRIACGTITLDTGHARLGIDPRDVISHYDDTGTAAVDCRVYEDAFGVVVAGAIRPELSANRLRALRASKLSGDWRRVNGRIDLVALLCVNTPGFPVPRPEAIIASVDGRDELLALVASGVLSDDDALTQYADDVYDALVAKMTDDVLIESIARDAIL